MGDDVDGEWIDYNGYDWYLTGRSAPGVGATLLIGYGLADEPVEELGALRALVEVLREELARPVETDPAWADPAERASWSEGDRRYGQGPVGYPEVLVHVSASVTRISLSGDLATVEASMVRLARLLETGSVPRWAYEAEADDRVVAEGPGWGPGTGRWLRDRVVRSGVNSHSVGGAVVRAPRLGPLLPALVRRLSPAAGERCSVIVVDDRLLVGAGFTRPGPGSQRRPDPRPSEVDLGADPRHRAGSVRATNEQDMLSVVAPYAPQSVAAFYLLAERASRALAARSEDCRLAFAMTPVEGHLLLEVLIDSAGGQVRDGGSGSPGSPGRSVVGALSLEDYEQILAHVARLDAPVTDTDVSWAMEKGREWLGPLYEPMCHLAGVAPSPDLDPVSVRAAYRALAGTIHLAVHTGAAPLEGYPLLVPDLPVRRGRTWHMWYEPGPEELSFLAPGMVVLRGSVLTTWIRRVAGRRLLATPAYLVADLSHLAVLAHHEPTDSYLLIDHHGGWASLTPGLLQHGSGLRKRILEAGKGLPPTALAYGDDVVARLEQARQRARLRRRASQGAMLVLTVFLCVALGAAAWDLSRRGQAGAGAGFITVEVGETATLDDGTTVTVGDPQVEETPDGQYLYTYGVDFCLGLGETGSKDSGEDAGGSKGASEETGAAGSPGASLPRAQQVSVRLFLLQYGDDLDWTAASEPDDEPLADRPLLAGECTSGRIGFLVDEEVDDAVVVMTDDDAGEVRWQER